MSRLDVEAEATEPGSFRDPDSRVVLTDGRVLRALSERGLADFTLLRDSGLLDELVAEEKLPRTTEVALAEVGDAGLYGGAAGALEHERIPFVSYPYEWSFEMLRDAALLQLELVRRAIAHGLMLKDSTSYNVQFRGARPLFVDVGSFEPMRPGEPWAGYRQFCMLFLNPLLLQAWKGVPFQPWLRGSIDGIAPQELRSVLSARDRFRRGAFTHVFLHARLDNRYEQRDEDVQGELKAAGFREELILANVRKLEKLVSRLRPKATPSTWSGYELTTTYSEDDAARKTSFVRNALTAERPGLVWDLGCNEGHHARIAAETADYVVAVDGDAVVIDRLYEELRSEGSRTVLPLTMNLVDPSPGLGWRGLERRALRDRGSPDLVFCLALVHHVSISGNVPVAAFLDWLRELDAAVVVEFPGPDDPMVRRLLARKRPHDHPDYTLDWFRRCLAERFEIVASETLAAGARTLFHVRPRV